VVHGTIPSVEEPPPISWVKALDEVVEDVFRFFFRCLFADHIIARVGFPDFRQKPNLKNVPRSHYVNAIVDTGATFSVISLATVKRLGMTSMIQKSMIQKIVFGGFYDAGGGFTWLLGGIEVDVNVFGGWRRITLLVSPIWRPSMIIGMDFLQDHDCTIRPKDYHVTCAAEANNYPTG